MKDQWMSKLNMHDFESLDDLRDSLMHWVQKYNQSPHSSLNGRTPQDRFFEESSLIIRMDEERIEKTFLLEAERRVSRDNVITLDDKEYEVNYKYAGQKLLLRYSPDLSKKTRHLHMKAMNHDIHSLFCTLYLDISLFLANILLIV